ncbi:MAG: O-antigen ligase family protein [Candidatus Sedimenticola endophacoides]
MVSESMERIRSVFFSSGWLMPIGIVILFDIGRALGNLGLAIYFIWGLLTLRRDDFRRDRVILLLYFCMLAAFALGIPGAVDSTLAFKGWFKFLYTSITFLFTFAALSVFEERYERAMRYFQVAAVAAFAVFAGRFFLFVVDGDSGGSAGGGLEVAWTFPFVIYGIMQKIEHVLARRLMVSFATLVVFVMLSQVDSSSEVLGFSASLLVYAFLSGWNKITIALVSPILIILVLLLELYPKLESAGSVDVMEFMAVWTSGRSVLWSEMLTTDHPSPVFGVGIKNISNNLEEFSRLGVNSAHNFILSVWYETGWTGLVFFSMFFGWVVGKIRKNYIRMTVKCRGIMVPWLSSISFILVVTLVDGYHNSLHFSFALMFMLALVYDVNEDAYSNELGGRLE